MDLEKLFLTRDELPILNDICFQIPIHPKLLDEKISINPNIAHEIFSQVAEEWCNELKERFPSGWKDSIQISNNGFVNGFSISRDYGGSLYFEKSDKNCEALFPSRLTKFSEEKSNEFKYKSVGNYSIGFVYASHNINDYPGALFLRNWAIKYMNEVFREIFK